MNRYSPFDEIEQFFGRTPFDVDRAWGRDFRTVDVDVAEYDDEFVVVADLPGYDRDLIDVRATDGRLTITAERVETTRDGEVDDEGSETIPGETGRYLRRERRRESVTRTVDLSSPVVEVEASATYRHGVLTVTLPKESVDDVDGHRIDVE
ncbi:Hsp20/alpha crystallin family protein [Halorubrum sp. Hd13]|uniref:Hsp20/alpha crystallin family protein n=1 Tax=Halorubrum sp. Hd13 TaxID=1480728 RepID=UPI000B983CBF|nr:Hsp20/alpha crystallin family protein [Halorubrum sp. Hd13]OYR44450.1 heat-shock protein Hsp20 [Halorubrum sp. Hd13]